MFIACQSAVKNHIRKRSGKSKNLRILDIGCGNGEYTNLFCRHKNNVTGIDLVNYVNKEYRKFKFIKCNAERLPFKDCSFDLIISFDVIEHIVDDQKALLEMNRVLKVGGKLFIETPNRYRLSYWILKIIGKKRTYPLELAPGCIHLREYDEMELKEKVIRGNFKNINIYPFWIGLRSYKCDVGLAKPPKLFRKLSQCWFVEAKK